jgi:hypothetical protein
VLEEKGTELTGVDARQEVTLSAGQTLRWPLLTVARLTVLDSHPTIRTFGVNIDIESLVYADLTFLTILALVTVLNSIRT